MRSGDKCFDGWDCCGERSDDEKEKFESTTCQPALLHEEKEIVGLARKPTNFHCLDLKFEPINFEFDEGQGLEGYEDRLLGISVFESLVPEDSGAASRR
ncbi:hypothetical protein ACFX1X_039419 [Malus domestica]